MIARMRKWFLNRAIRKCLKKRAPSQFTYAESNDYYVPSVEQPDNALILIDELRAKKAIGRVWFDDRFRDPITLSEQDLDQCELKVHRFYGYANQKYETLREFYLAELTLRVQREWLRDKINQVIYNKTTRFRRDRIEVLKRLVEIHSERALANNALLYEPQKLSVVSLFSEVYGSRIYGHPARENESARFRLILESLVASGELIKNSKHEFTLTGKALQSIGEYEQVERRHQDNIVQSRRLLLLTVVLALAALAQVGVEIWKHLNPNPS